MKTTLGAVAALCMALAAPIASAQKVKWDPVSSCTAPRAAATRRGRRKAG